MKERIIMKHSSTRTIFGVALVATLVIAAAAMASDPPPTSCTTDEYGAGDWLVEVSQGPCTVACGAPSTDPADPFCDPAGSCTGIEYKITELGTLNADHLVTLVRDVDVSWTDGQAYDPCEGEPVTGLGRYACHERAVRLNKNRSVNQYNRLVVEGAVETIPTSVALKAGRTIEACRIAGLGRDTAVPETCVPTCGGFDPKQTILRTEVLQFEDCSVEFKYDLGTGALVSATLTPESVAAGCDFDIHDVPVGTLELLVGGTSLGMGAYGDGYLSLGSDSCTCRIYGGRVYCWGLPCP